MRYVWGSLFFLSVLAGVAVFVLAINDVGPLAKHWFPTDVSETGYHIDNLFLLTLYITGAVFVLTGGILAWVVFRHGDSGKAVHVHGDTRLELIWTLIPAGILVFLTFWQIPVWAEFKLTPPVDASGATQPPLAEIVARQFEWRIRYAGQDGQLGTADDIYDVNELRIPTGESVVLRLKSEDVIHSFYLPNFRLKQDIVPGMRQHVWFRTDEPGRYDIVCTELCGWGHYKMRGQVIAVSRSEYESFLQEAYAQQEAVTNVPEESDD